MTIQDLGSIGELVAAIATVATLVYLAVQVRQNTRALRSSTFQHISEQMCENAVVISTHPDLAAVLVKGSGGMGSLTPEERMRFQAFFVMTLRRMEAVYMQNRLGSIDEDQMAGFELSLLTVLRSVGGSEWWVTAKAAFNRSFSAYVDRRLARGDLPDVHPSMGLAERR